MKRIDNLTDDANQSIDFELDDGSIISFDFIYRLAIQRWQMSLVYGDFILNNINLCIHPNLLMQWRNVLAFGVCCISTDGGDPVDVFDFTNGRIEIYILDSSDVSLVESNITLASL